MIYKFACIADVVRIYPVFSSLPHIVCIKQYTMYNVQLLFCINK